MYYFDQNMIKKFQIKKIIVEKRKHLQVRYKPTEFKYLDLEVKPVHEWSLLKRF